MARGLERGAVSGYASGLNGLTAPDARRVLANLKAAEARHLAAVTNRITA